MTRHAFDRAVERLARRQHGVFTHAQILMLGGTKAMVHSRLSSGAWVRLHPGVHALASFPGTWPRQLKAAELATGGAVAGPAAAALHELAGFRPCRPELVVGPTGNTRRPGVRVRRRAAVPTTTVRGIRVTTVAETLLDVAVCVPVPMLERAIDDALLTGQVSLPVLSDRLAVGTLGRRAGVQLLRAVVAERQVDGWSPAESELEYRLLPLVEAGHRWRSHPAPGAAPVAGAG